MLTLEQCIEQYITKLDKKNPSARKTNTAQKSRHKDAIVYCKNFMPLYENDEALDQRQIKQEKAHAKLVHAHNDAVDSLHTLGETVNKAFDTINGDSQ